MKTLIKLIVGVMVLLLSLPVMSQTADEFGGEPEQIYPGQSPRLTLSSDFLMPAVIINEEHMPFDMPTKHKIINLDTGLNTIKTVGGDVRDCEFSFDAEEGKIYRKHCGTYSSSE